MIQTNNLFRRSPRSLRSSQFTFVGGTSNSQLGSNPQSKSIFPDPIFLSNVRENDRVAISAINTDRDTCIYLYQLGLKPKTTVRIVSHQTSGSVILSFGERQIGLGSEITQKILVTLAGEKK